MTEALRIKAPRLEAFIARAFEAVDVQPADAKTVAALMTRADVNGLVRRQLGARKASFAPQDVAVADALAHWRAA